MRDYILRRLLMLIPVLLGISLSVFLIMQLVPGDVVSGILGIEIGFGVVVRMAAESV